MPTVNEKIRIWPIGSGKGGVGKTLLTANLGILLSRLGKKVIILDADLGASNLHTALGIPYTSRTLNDLLTGFCQNLNEIIQDTPFPGLRLIGGSRQLPGFPDYHESLTQKIMSGLPHLDADILLIDLGGGISPHLLDLFLLSERGIVVMTNDPASIQNTYHFLKMAVYRKILQTFPNNPLISYMVNSTSPANRRDRIRSVPELIDKLVHVDHYYADVIRRILDTLAPQIIINMVNKRDDSRAVHVVDAVSQRFVGIKPELLGTLEYDTGIQDSTLNFRPFTLAPENMKSSEQLNLIAHRLLKEETPSEQPAQKAPSEPLEKPSQERKEVWLMNNVQHRNRPLYVLTEKLNRDGAIQTSIYFRGKILFTRKMQYPELKGNNVDDHTLRKYVRKQHRTAIKGIEKGRIPFNDDK